MDERGGKRGRSPFYEQESDELDYDNYGSPVTKVPRVSDSSRGGVYIRVVDTCGTSVDLTVKEMSQLDRDVKKYFMRHKSSRRGVQLLTMSFSELKREVEEKRYNKLMEVSQQNEEYSMELLSSNSNSDESGLLWGEKYAPKLYTELLSDDGINRSLLSWVKLWDYTVFGTPCRLKDTTNTRSHENKRGGRGGERGGRGGGERGGRGGGERGGRGGRGQFTKPNAWEIQDPNTFATEEALDEHRKPKQKLVLLCGSPGIGKTTLAHTVANQCGYTVVELNASDDRSPELFRKVLESSTGMKSVLTTNSKPNCLIIDEIDGAPNAAINVLIELLKPAKNTKKKSLHSLSRPILCICNDLYAPSLRTLKQHAIIFNVPSIATSRLANRLMDICRKERLLVSMPTLMALCEKADNDVRTCLNTLQFIHRRRSDVSLSTVQSIAIGHKDSQRSLLSLWKEILKLPSAKKYTSMRAEQGDSVSVKEQSLRFWYILSEATSTGEYDKVLQGLFENYLNVKIRDTWMDVISETQEWIMFHESLSVAVHSSQLYQLMAYMPFITVVFHFFYATTTTGHKVQYPHAQFEANQKYQRFSQLISQLLEGSIISREVDPVSCTVYSIPLLLNIITPNFRPVNIQLYTKAEKSLLHDIVSTMISYSLTYRQERTPDGQYVYTLEPDLDELCHFPGLPQKKQLQYSTKQLLAREIEVTKVKRQALPVEPHPSVGGAPKTTYKVISSTKGMTPVISEKINTKTSKVKRDFFGQPLPSQPAAAAAPINKSPQNNNNNKRYSDASSGPPQGVWFKFNEGFSDAIKKTVRIKDFINKN